MVSFSNSNLVSKIYRRSMNRIFQNKKLFIQIRLISFQITQLSFIGSTLKFLNCPLSDPHSNPNICCFQRLVIQCGTDVVDVYGLTLLKKKIFDFERINNKYILSNRISFCQVLCTQLSHISHHKYKPERIKFDFRNIYNFDFVSNKQTHQN